MASNGTEMAPIAPITAQISVPPYTLFCHITIFPKSATANAIISQPVVVNVTTTESGASPLSALVYAIPRPTGPALTSTLFGGMTSESQESLEFATRLARYAAKKTSRPVYAGATVGGFLPQVEAVEKVTAVIEQSVV
ncbi:hypothetical protein V1512DRAFT_262181 [Lipomyces arxii]|uniref:uncharacterized protein n=1 Tax=Lipomyces arxii TaxID=56418 RepID=UPI0034CD8440